MANITLTSSTPTAHKIDITTQILAESVQIGIVSSKMLGMSHRVFAIKIDDNYYTVAMKMYGPVVKIRPKYLSSNGKVIVVPKKSIDYWD